jgi:hypothetical protein
MNKKNRFSIHARILWEGFFKIDTMKGQGNIASELPTYHPGSVKPPHLTFDHLSVIHVNLLDGRKDIFAENDRRDRSHEDKGKNQETNLPHPHPFPWSFIIGSFGV